MAHGHPTRAAVAATIAVLIFPLAACNDDEPAAGGNDPAPSTSTSESSPAETDDASPTAAPATGPLLQLPNAEYHVPEGWKRERAMIDLQTTATSPDASGSARLFAVEMPAAGSEMPLDDLTRNALASAPAPKPKVLDPVEIGDVEWYHLSGKVGSSMHSDDFGTVHDGYQTTISFTFFASISPQERDETIAASLASFAWR